MFSKNYIKIIKKYGNGFSGLSSKINSFKILLKIFKSIKNDYDFKHFRNNFPPEWIYIPSIRLKNKSLWTKLFSFIYDYHKNNDKNFMFGYNKDEFINYINDMYEKILLYGGIDYVEGQDLTVTFCNEPILDIINKYCSNNSIENFNKYVFIHPIERKGSINKVLFYRATKENKFVDKMFDDYQEGKNTKRIASDFLDYLDEIKK